jgi:hypothetical protein
MNSQKDHSVLLAFARTEGDGRYKINIYGTPDGLRNLASELVKQAQADQTHLAHYDTDHTHYKSNHRNAVLAPSLAQRGKHGFRATCDRNTLQLPKGFPFRTVSHPTFESAGKRYRTVYEKPGGQCPGGQCPAADRWTRD